MKNERESKYKIITAPSGERFVDMGMYIPSLLAPSNGDQDEPIAPEHKIVTAPSGERYVDLGVFVPSLMAPTHEVQGTDNLTQS